MGIFDKSREKNKKGKCCAGCGEKLYELEPGVKPPLWGAAYMDPTQGVPRIALELQRPGYRCKDCGSIICRGCIRRGESQKCPKCGSENMESLL